MALIKLNYELAIAQVARLRNAAAECESLCSDVNKQIRSIESSWEGNAAAAMIGKLNQWVADTTKIKNQLISEAAAIKSKADQLKAIDDSAISIGSAAGGSNASGTGSGGGGFRGTNTSSGGTGALGAGSGGGGFR